MRQQGNEQAVVESGCTTMLGLGIAALIALGKLFGLIPWDWIWIIAIGGVAVASFVIDYIVLRPRRK